MELTVWIEFGREYIEDSSGMVRLTAELVQITNEEIKSSIETFLTNLTKDLN